jgi:branched-chain amino acid transport system permease protein
MGRRDSRQHGGGSIRPNKKVGHIMLDSLQLLAQAPILNAQLILDGIFVGAVYGLAAYGLALVWGVMNLKNLAQGDFVIMGGYLAWMLGNYGIHPFVALPIVVALMFVFGWVIYRTIIWRVINKDLFTSLLATFGLALVMQQILNQIFGPEVQSIDAGFRSLTLFNGMVTIPQVKLISLCLTALLAVFLVAFMKWSRMGQAIRATAQDPRAARVMGIDTERVYAFTFALNSAICGAAGVLIAMIWVIQPFYGIAHSIRAFVIVTMAGLGNLSGVIVAALGLGVTEQYAGFTFGAQLQQFTVVSLLVLVLLYKQFRRGRSRQVLQ